MTISTLSGAGARLASGAEEGGRGGAACTIGSAGAGGGGGCACEQAAAGKGAGAGGKEGFHFPPPPGPPRGGPPGRGAGNGWLTRSARKARFEIEFTSIGSFSDASLGDCLLACCMMPNVRKVCRFASGLVTVRTSTDAQAVSARKIAAGVASGRRVVIASSI